MKNKAYFLPAFLPLLIAGCTTKVETILPEDKILDTAPSIELSEHIVILDEDNAKATITVASNRLEWRVENDIEWLDVTEEGSTFTLALGNMVSDAYTGYIYVATAGEDDVPARDSVYVAILPSDVRFDLSAGGTANSYIVKTGTSYKFDATVKGNGKNKDGGSRYIETYGLAIDGAYAELLWEATFNGDRTESSHIIDGPVIYSDGYINFKTGASQGNAGIAVKSVSGDILWSWHIWVVDEEIRIVEGLGRQWMDRNLGAVTTTPADLDNQGLLYQWGRKDPFLPTSLPFTQSSYDPWPDNLQTGNGTGEWVYSKQPRTLSHAPGNLPYVIKEPMAFISQYGGILNNYYDWYVVVGQNNDYEDSINAFLWGKADDPDPKTIFDPCPPGYLVVDRAPFVDVDGDSIGFMPGTEEEYGYYAINLDNLFFPNAGMRTPSKGAIHYSRKLAAVWTRDQGGVDYAWRRRLSEELGGAVETHSRINGSSIRCVKE